MTNSKALLFSLLAFISGVFIASFCKVPKLIIYELFLLGFGFGLIFASKKPIAVLGICLMMLGLGLFRCEIAKEKLAESGTPLSLAEFRTPLASGVGEASSPFIRVLAGAQGKMEAVISKHFSPPQSGLLIALLLGNQKKISYDWKLKFNASGIRHITSVSGMHVVIFAGILFWLAIAFGLYRGRAFYFAIVFLWLFIAMIGFQAAAVRAGVMGTMLLFCQKIGRQSASGRALVLSAGLMLAINPLLLRWDIGFQLSFLATLGIIYFAPILHNSFSNFCRLFLQKFSYFNLNFKTSPALHETFSGRGDLKLQNPDFQLQTLDLGPISMTFAAQIFTFPILAYNFGNVSLVAPIANILVAPVISFIMVFGLAFLALALIFPGIGFLLSLPSWLLLSYILGVAEFFCALPFAVLDFKIHWAWIFVFYAILAGFLWFNKKRQRERSLP